MTKVINDISPWDVIKSTIKYIRDPLVIFSGGFHTNTGVFKICYVFNRGCWETAPLFGKYCKGYLPDRDYLYALPRDKPTAIVTWEKEKGFAKYPVIDYLNMEYDTPLLPEQYFFELTFDISRGVPEIPFNVLKYFSELPEGIKDHSWCQYYPKMINGFPVLYLRERGLRVKNFLTVKEALVLRMEEDASRLTRKVTQEIKVAHHCIRFSDPVYIERVVPNVMKLCISKPMEVTVGNEKLDVPKM